MTPAAFRYIDVIVVPLGDLPNVQKELERQIKQAGKQVWLYTSIHPQGDWANRFIEQPLIKTQLLPWIAFKYNMNGYLHWALNFWQQDPYKGVGLPPYNLPGGDEFVVYPGDQTINPSLRAIAMRNGLNDVALLSLLKQKKPADASRIASALVSNYSVYNTDMLNYHQRKTELLKLLVK